MLLYDGFRNQFNRDGAKLGCIPDGWGDYNVGLVGDKEVEDKLLKLLNEHGFEITDETLELLRRRGMSGSLSAMEMLLSKPLFPRPSDIRDSELLFPLRPKGTERPLIFELRDHHLAEIRNDPDSELSTLTLDELELPYERVDVVGLLKGTNRDYLITNKKVIFPDLKKGGVVTPHKIKVLNKRIDKIEYGYKQIKIEELRDKYVVIASFVLPILCHTMDAAPYQAIISLSEELRRQGVVDCKFVLVISVLPYLRDQKAEFDRFLLGFPDDILAVPFEDVQSRESLCKKLCISKSLIVDPHGNNLGSCFHDLVYYGPSYFPFSKTHLSDIEKQDELLMARLNTFSYKNSSNGKDDYLDIDTFPTLSLGELFQCGPTSCLVKGVSPDLERLPVSDLDGKFVFLYLFETPSFMARLKLLQQKCRSVGCEFEVVVMPLAFFDSWRSYERIINNVMVEHNIDDWWSWDVSTSSSVKRVVRSLGRISLGRYCFGRDVLIVLPNGKFSGENDAIAVLNSRSPQIMYHDTSYDINELSKVFPFTREKLCSSITSALREFTLLSLLDPYIAQVCGILDDSAEQLRGENVLLFINPYDKFSCGSFLDVCKTLKCVYPAIVKGHPGCQVVCVFPCNDSSQSTLWWLSELRSWKQRSWLMIKEPEQAVDSLRKALLLDPVSLKGPPVIISFGKDGHICSRNVLGDVYRLEHACLESELSGKEYPAFSPFDDKLDQEICGKVTSDVEFYIESSQVVC